MMNRFWGFMNEVAKKIEQGKDVGMILQRLSSDEVY